VNWQPLSPSPDRRPDIEEFLAQIESSPFFASDRPLLITRAPGRLDLMGGIADYSGSLVLELPLAVATLVAAQECPQPSLVAFSTAAESFGELAQAEIPIAELGSALTTTGYSRIKERLERIFDARWFAYVAGGMAVLAAESGAHANPGIRLWIHSHVPTGKGVGSSAALEVAVISAIAALLEIPLTTGQLARYGQIVENQVVGAPCGIMDQMTSACGEEGRLLKLLCQPDRCLGNIPLPPGIEVWGIDSAIRHAVSGSEYGLVRTGAFMGYRMIAALEGLPVTAVNDGKVQIADHLWNGYLANISVKDWISRYRDRLPETISGDEFIKRFQGITDPVTQVDPERIYTVRQPTAHPILERERVEDFLRLLERQPHTDESLAGLGAIMAGSHASYTACGLGSDGTDRLVDLVQEAGPEHGLFGAKITGGGSGGTVAVLGRRGAGPAVQEIAARYARETGKESIVLAGSSPGAVQFGVVHLVSR